MRLPKLCLLLVTLILSSCSETTGSYPDDGTLIRRFKEKPQLFANLVSNPTDPGILEELDAVSSFVAPSGNMIQVLVWREAFIGGSCVKGYVYFAEPPSVDEIPGSLVNDIDIEVDDPDGCGPKELNLHRKLDPNWYLFYSSAN